MDGYWPSLNAATLTQLAGDFENGGLVTFCLHGSHYYYMTGYDAATGTFKLVNEYKVTDTHTLELNLSELENSSGSWFCELSP
jgi:hypothetical protein